VAKNVKAYIQETHYIRDQNKSDKKGDMHIIYNGLDLSKFVDPETSVYIIPIANGIPELKT
jgi:hypothetical protein